MVEEGTEVIHIRRDVNKVVFLQKSKPALPVIDVALGRRPSHGLSEQHLHLLEKTSDIL